MSLPDTHRTPSALSHRLPALLLAAGGLGVSAYLTLYQAGALRTVWDPVFGAGSARVLRSAFSRSLPVPDASLGAAGYLADLVLGAAGGSRRWRRVPWLVLLFGVIVTGMAATGLALLTLQALVVRSWCLLCITSALISIAILLLSLPEIAASWKHVQRRRRQGVPFRQALVGG